MASVLMLEVIVTNGITVEKRPTWDEFIAEYDAEAALTESRIRNRERTATDLGVTTDDLRDSKQAERMRAERARLDKGGTWEGPLIHFSILLGGSHPWDGPNAVMVVFPDGGKRCRGCGERERLPAATYCLHCSRSGADHLAAIRGTRAKPHDPKPEAPKLGPQTRKEKRRVKVE